MNPNMPEALTFSSPFDMDTILKKFNCMDAVKWKFSDSDTYGDYLIGHPVLDIWPVTLRLFLDKEKYVLDFGYSYWRLNEGQTPDQAIKFVKDQLLPAIGATNVKETSAFR